MEKAQDVVEKLQTFFMLLWTKNLEDFFLIDLDILSNIDKYLTGISMKSFRHMLEKR